MKKVISENDIIKFKNDFNTEIDSLERLVQSGYITRETFSLAIKNFRERLNDLYLQLERKFDTKSILNDLNERQMKLLEYLIAYDKINRMQYRTIFEVSNMTAYRDLNDLKNKKLVSEIGKGRGTFYVLVKR